MLGVTVLVDGGDQEALGAKEAICVEDIHNWKASETDGR